MPSTPVKVYRPRSGVEYLSGLAALTVMAKGSWADVVGVIAAIILIVVLVWVF